MENPLHTHKGNFISSILVDSRLDATFYTPEAIEAEQKLIEGEQAGYYSIMPLEAISSYIMDFQAFSVYNYVEFSESYKSGWLEFLRVQDLERGYVDTGKVLWTSPESHDLMKKSVVLPGDILISIIGTLGIATRWIQQHECNSNQCIAKIRTKPVYDPGYVVAALNSSTIQKLIHRNATGTVQKGLSLGGTRRLRLPIPEPKIQAYIGDKVRLSEMCREEAHRDRKVIDDLLNQYAKKSAVNELLNQKQAPSHIVNGKLIDDRVDAEFFQQAYLRLDELIQAGPFISMGDIIYLPIKGIQPEYDSAGTVPALTGTYIDPNRLETNQALRVRFDWATGKAKKALAAEGEILFTVTGPPLGEAAVVHAFQCPLVINSHVARIKSRDHFKFPFYLAAMMNSAIVSAQVYRYCKGVRQKELYPEEIMRFVIPEVPIDIVRQINQLGFRADFLEYRSTELIKSAISDVDQLIEGTLNLTKNGSGTLVTPNWDDIQRVIKRQNNYA